LLKQSCGQLKGTEGKMSFLQLNNISKNYGTRKILAPLSIAVEPGEFVSIVGISGMGKTSLLSIAAGLRESDSGEVLMEGKPVKGFPDDASIVFQNYSLLPWLSALQNVMLAVESARPDWSTSRRQEQCEKYLKLVGLGSAMAKKPHELSGGMRQRVAIARAFATEPRMLFLDEPFGALDALTRGTMQQELLKLCSATEQKMTVLMITNHVDEALVLSDRVFALSRGPEARLFPEVCVDLPKPRVMQELAQDLGAIQLRERIVGYLMHKQGLNKSETTAKLIAAEQGA
jgi:nitrate/nitrite transport system ATP-binding protein